MSTQGKEPFLSRWSRRKVDSVTEIAVSKPAGTATPAAAAPAAAPLATKPELPPVDSLRGLASEYKDFLRPGVDEKLRQSALKKLFHDPHFNVMDGLDTYIDDYSKPDPIPEAMLRTLEHARGLLFDEEKKTAGAEPEKSGEKPAAAAQPQAPGEARAEAPASPPAPEAKPETPASGELPKRA
jgi:hypothetical protein